MNSERFAELAARSQEGDKASLEQLLILAYTPVSYQCRKLLQNNRAAEDMTKEILQSVQFKLHTLNNPKYFEKWLGNIIAKRCMQVLSQQTMEKTVPPKKVDVPGEYLDERETAMVVDQIVDSLPDGPRICITLYCCSEIPASGIARLTGFTESAVNAHLGRAQALINGRLQKLYQQGVHFASITSLPELLRIAMFTPRNPKAASAMVNSILAKRAAAAPVRKAKPKKNILIVAVIAAAVLLLILLVAIFFLERNYQRELTQETTAPVTETTLAETEATTVATTVETTAETTVETTIETTVETTMETTEEVTEATTEPTEAAAPKAQQSQGSQPVSSGGSVSSGTGGTHVHSYQDAGPIGAQSAGCESPGWRTKICFVCGDTVRYEDPVNSPALGHNYSSTVKPPTTGREGYTVHTCTRCGLTYMDNYVPKLPEETQPPEPQAPETAAPEAPAEPIPES